ncbi:TLC domain protein [Gregarina niphandrodes]|uniref:TLC domain protein n=1 Tax=Gregarina niphandrodes TaxID=110365 RepID=A0A023BAW4_GRENI|nr:TLC domain protein [Gregarina niphandrodes]EZG78492.1 TLC domain protein [Gregarina niphandrodes]|eukprot:XP_011129276.1 TLC domain protein [Gregarina niphandrodes]
MPLRQAIRQRQKHEFALPLGLALGFWTFFYKFVGDRCRTNGTAFFHAILVSPIMILSLMRLKHDRYWGESTVFDAVAVVVAGYFAWDLGISILQYKEYGFSFLLHAVICLSCMMLHLLAKEMRTSWIIAGMIATECSTIFLHLRWFMIQAKLTHRLYFKIVNVLFMLTFASYRMYYVAVIAIFPYTRHVLTHKNFGLNRLDAFRIWYQMVTSWLWLGLQYYWGFALVRSQLSQMTKRWKKRD